VLPLGRADCPLTCRIMLAHNNEAGREQPARATALAFAVSRHDDGQFHRLTRQKGIVYAGQVEARTILGDHAHAVPAHADKEVRAGRQYVLQAARLGITAITNDQAALGERESAETFATIGSGQFEVGEAGRGGVICCFASFPVDG
jgi:hypothetical protein